MIKVILNSIVAGLAVFLLLSFSNVSPILAIACVSIPVIIAAFTNDEN